MEIKSVVKLSISQDDVMTKFAPQPLLTPFRMGDLLLPNRIVMAPLTRQRAANPGHVPTRLQAQYYAQRASAGLIVSEGTAISPEGFGWADTPGLWNKEQISGWRFVTDTVHKAGGRIIAQLWHTGSISHPDLLNGALPVSASDVNPLQQSVTPTGRKPTVTPRAMTKAEIRQTAKDYGKAAQNAIEAGFDGVQVQANYLYLIPQFLNRATNLRTDEYGGSIENRSRFLFEVIESVLDVLDSGSVGIKIAPMHEKGPFAANEETLPTAEYVIKRLNDYSLSHLLMMGESTDFSGSPLATLAGDGMFRHFRSIFKGPLVANVKMDRDRGNRLINEGLADLVAYGRPYISNPDLVTRFATDSALNSDIKSETIYAPGAAGYIDYPEMKVIAEPREKPAFQGSKKGEIMAKEHIQQTINTIYNQVFNEGRYDLYPSLVSGPYIQHNPLFPNGLDGILGYIKQAGRIPCEVKRIAIDGDLAFVHVRYLNWGGKETAGVDIFRFNADGKIVEHWDVLQPVPGSSKNSNTMF